MYAEGSLGLKYIFSTTQIVVNKSTLLPLTPISLNCNERAQLHCVCNVCKYPAYFVCFIPVCYHV